MDLLRTFRYARRYRNWREILAANRSSRHPSEAVLRQGIRLSAPPNVNPTRAANGVFFKRCYTPAGFEIGAGDVVVDVGANIGAFTLYAAARTRARVIAIEPFPGNLEYLEGNVRANGFDHVTVLGCAVSDREGTTRLAVHRSGVMHRLADLGSTPPGDSIEVPVATLAGIAAAQGLERIDLLKLDCEGAEGRILASAPPALLARVGRVALEFHDDASPLDHDALCKLLEAQGFRTRLDWDRRSANGFLYAWREPGSSSASV